MKHILKNIANIIVLLAISLTAKAESKSIQSPNNILTLTVEVTDGNPCYSVLLDGKTMVEPSRLGLVTNYGDWSKGLKVNGMKQGHVTDDYTLRTAKASRIHYEANTLTVDCESANGFKFQIEFRVSDRDVAFRYTVPQKGDVRTMVVSGEASSFRLPEKATSFLCPQSQSMVGWMRTKPSYEEEYTPDAPLAEKSRYGEGYTFPCLSRVGDDGWVLISETGTDGSYAGCHLSDWNAENGYSIALPMEGECNGLGSAKIGLSLPQSTAWRTITVGSTLKPIVETTVSYDIVPQRYEPSIDYRNGRYTWSWLIWQDNSINVSDQLKFIDLASEMGYEYCLIDNYWDERIGRDNIEQIAHYARSQNVGLLLWYSSNGYENDAPQGPRNCMNSSINRHKEMKWMKSIGIKGIKVDFLGGDKQHTMQLYEDILADANEYGLQVIFHGCTLPRGWERMYPNFVANEAVLASENVFFNPHHAETQAFELCMHPFCRNTVASMDWGGVIMNRFLSQDNKSRHARQTTNVFEMASGIINQCAVQCVAMTPNNLDELTKEELDWLRYLPAGWDETMYIDGYPGRYVVLARRQGEKWYVAGLNATDQPLSLDISTPFAPKTELSVYEDDAKTKQTALRKAKADAKSQLKITMQPKGGVIVQAE